MFKELTAIAAIAMILLFSLLAILGISGDRAAMRAAECRNTAMQKERPAAEIHLICGEYR